MEIEVNIPADKPSQIIKWFVKKGSAVRQGSVLCSYKTEGSKGTQKLKCAEFGTVTEILAFLDSEVKPRGAVLKIKGCSHPVVMKDMCAECGEDLREQYGVAGDRKGQSSASVAMVHSIPELIVSTEQAVELGKEDEQRLLNTRKLVLLVDLDETLLHTTNDNVPPNLKDVYHFQLQHGPSMLWYHTKFRPGTQQFLEKMSKLYELHICTFGARMYAHTMAGYLDPEKKYFSHRILSRDECFDSRSKQANLRALFPCGDGMVCIIDDREEVWKFTPNMIKVKPYHFFEHTADINAPPGMERTEDDTDVKKRTVKIHKIPRKKKDSVSEKVTESHKENDSEKLKSEPNDEQKRTKQEEITKVPDSGDAKAQTEKEESGEQKSGEKQIESPALEERTADTIAQSPDSKHTMKSGSESSFEHSQDTADLRDSTKESDTSDKPKSLQAEDTVECINEFVGEEMDVSSSDNENEQSADITDKSVKQNANSKLNKDSDGQIAKENKNVDFSTGNDDGVKTSDTKQSDVKKDDVTDEEYDEIIEWEDTDDYLLYLEEILSQVHKIFFDMHDQLKQKSVDVKEEEKPNVKKIVPYAKQKVLSGKNIVFSGVVPTNMPLEKSRPFLIAKSLGAHVQTDVVTENKRTTHVVAAKMGAVKVKEALKHKDIAVVTPDWLWLCDWRWEHVDERLFLLDKKSTYTPNDAQSKQGSSLKRKAPEEAESKIENDDVTSSKRQKSSSESDVNREDSSLKRKAPNDTERNAENDDITTAKRQKSNFESEPVRYDGNKTVTPSTQDQVNPESVVTRRFSDSINPLALLSQDDIDSLSREVEEMSDDSDSEEGQDGQKGEGGNGQEDEDEDLGSDDATLRQQVLGFSSPETSSDESMSGDYPQGWRPKSNSPSYEDNSHLLEIDDPHEAKQALYKAARSSNHFLFEEESNNSVTENSEDSQDSGDDELAAAVERGLFS